MDLHKHDTLVIKNLKKQVKSKYHVGERAKVVDDIIAAVKLGKIRLRLEEDQTYRLEDMKGDCFCPSVNSDIDPKKLRRQELAYERKIREQGVWGAVSSYWTGREWEEMEDLQHNSIWAFVGNEFFGSGYELQIMEEALEAYNRQPLDAAGFVIDPFIRS